jgi:hypothetical protein
MNFFIIHNAKFPLRKEFIDAQFKRYCISDYEFVDIESETELVSAYVNTFEKIAQIKNILYGVVIIDTVLLSRHFLEYIYFAYLQMTSSGVAQDIIFINRQTISETYGEKIMETRMLHATTWYIDDIDTNYSSSFIVSKRGARIIIQFNKVCIKMGEYESANSCFTTRDPETKKHIQTFRSVNLFLFNASKFYTDDFSVYWLR